MRLGYLLAFVILINPSIVWAAAPPQRISPELGGHAGEQSITPELLLAEPPGRTYVFQSLQWAGAREELVYALEDHKGRQSIYSLNLRTHLTDQLSDGFSPRISPDGSILAFLVPGRGGFQLRLMKLASAARTTTSLLATVTVHHWAELQVAWSPDSQQIALAFRSSTQRAWQTGNESMPNPEVTSAVDVDEAIQKWPSSQIWVYSIHGGRGKKVGEVQGFVQSLCWTGQNLLYSALERSYEQTGQPPAKTLLEVLDIDSQRVHTVRDFPMLEDGLRPTVGPDNSTIAVTADITSPYLASTESVVTFSLRGNGRDSTELSHGAKMADAAWLPAGNAILARRYYGPYAQLYRVNIKTGVLTQLTSDPAHIEAFALSPRGEVAVYTTNADGDAWIKVLSSVDSAAPKWSFEEQVVNQSAGLLLGAVREISWHSEDGVESRGLLFLPTDFSVGKRYPLVVNLHGGLVGAPVNLSYGALTLHSPLEFHMWAANGYVVFLPEFRSSGALGVEMRARQSRESEVYGFRGDAKDILSGIDSVVALGIADSSRVAVVGFSGGAAETNWLVSTTRDKFRAAVSSDGFAEVYMLSAVGAALGGDPDSDRILSGWPWQIPDRYLQNSAIYHVLGATTPTLFLMGETELSGIDPTLSSQFMYSALKRQGVETRYVRYPGEGHGLQRPANLRDSVQRATAWIRHYLSE